MTIQHVNPVASDAPLSITVNTSTLSGITHKDIKVNLAKSAGTLTSTANSVIAAVNADATAGPLIQGSLCTNVAAACDATNDGTGLVTAPGVSVQSQGFANGDTIKLSTGELVIVTAGGGRHGTNGPVAGTSLTVQRNAWGTTPASGTVTSGTSAATQVGLFDNATIAHDTDHDAFLLVGYDNGSDTHSMQVYCNTENNPTPGTLTAAQQ